MLGIWASFVQTFFVFDSPVFLLIVVNKNTFASYRQTYRQTVIYWDTACLSFSDIWDVKIYKHFTYPSNVYKNHFYFIFVHLPSNMICYILAWALISSHFCKALLSVGWVWHRCKRGLNTIPQRIHIVDSFRNNTSVYLNVLLSDR